MGTTSNKMVYLNETKQKLKTYINTFGGNITDESTFRSYIDKLNNVILNSMDGKIDLYSLYPKYTGSADEVSLNNTEKYKIKFSLLCKELSQNGTPSPDTPISLNVIKGKNNIKIKNENLFDKENMNIFNGGIQLNTLVMQTSEANRSLWISCNPNTTYTIQKRNDGNTNRFAVASSTVPPAAGSSLTKATRDDNSNVLTITTGSSDIYLIVQFYRTAESEITYRDVIDSIQIEIEKKNLFDKDNANILNAYIDRTTTTITSINNNRIVWIPCNPNTTYTISRMNGFQPNVAWTEETPAIGVSSYGQVKAENNVATITTEATAKYLIVRVYQATTDTESLETVLNSLQIEEGNQATSYEPYQSQIQNYSIDLGDIEYTKIGTTEDKIYRDENGDWYFEEHIGKKILNGTENWILSSAYTNDTILSVFVPISGKDNAIYKSDKFPYMPVISASTTEEYIRANGTSVRIGIFKSRLTEGTPAAFKTWLTQNNVKTYYELATPITTKITDTSLGIQLENLYQNAMSYKGSTIITQLNDGLPFTLEYAVLKEI